jgi:hypothetical protein
MTLVRDAWEFIFHYESMILIAFNERYCQDGLSGLYLLSVPRMCTVLIALLGMQKILEYRHCYLRQNCVCVKSYIANSENWIMFWNNPSVASFTAIFFYNFSNNCWYSNFTGSAFSDSFAHLLKSYGVMQQDLQVEWSNKFVS